MRYSILYPIQRSGVRLARTGTSVTPPQPAMASAASAEVLARARWPSSAAAPEYSARRSAAVSAVMERRNARTAGRSALAQSCAMVDLIALILAAQEGKSRLLPTRSRPSAVPPGMTFAGEWARIPPNRPDLQRNWHGFNDIAKNGIGGFRFFLQRSVARTGDDAMRENGDRKLFEVVGEAIVAAIEVGAGLRGALKHECAAGADAERELLAFARAIDHLESVVVQAGIDFDVGNGVLHRQHIADIRDRIERIERIIANALSQNFLFRFVRRIAHFDAHEKAIELRFRQRIGAVMLDGILRGDDQKRLGQRERFAVDGDLRFVHGFEKRGLGARRGAIDFVGEDHVGENWAGTKFKIARFGIVDADAENIAGEQVRRELDALKAAMKRFCERLRESGLANAGNVFDEQMAAGEQGNQRELDGVFLAVECARDGEMELRDDLGRGGRHLLKTRALPVTNRWRFRQSRLPACGRLAQLVRALPSHGRGQRFKSFVAHNF